MIPSNAYSSCKLYRLRLTVLMGRNGAGDPTSSPNIAEEYHTSDRMVNVMFVYVLNCHGVRYENVTCFVFGRRSSGYFDLRTLDGTKVSASASYKKLNLVQKASALLVERRAAFPPVP